MASQLNSSSLSLIILPENNILRSHIIALKLPLWSGVKKRRALTKTRRRRANCRKSIINYPIIPQGTMSPIQTKNSPGNKVHCCAVFCMTVPLVDQSLNTEAYGSSVAGAFKALSLSARNVWPRCHGDQVNISNDASTVMWIFQLLKLADARLFPPNRSVACRDVLTLHHIQPVGWQSRQKTLLESAVWQMTYINAFDQPMSW